MKTDNHAGSTIKVVNALIIAMVVGGSVVFAVINQATTENEVMTTLFLAFLGAIITIQIIPCLVLLGSILKGIINLVRKQAPAEAVKRTDSAE